MAGDDRGVVDDEILDCPWGCAGAPRGLCDLHAGAGDRDEWRSGSRAAAAHRDAGYVVNALALCGGVCVSLLWVGVYYAVVWWWPR